MKTVAKYKYPELELTDGEVRSVGFNRELNKSMPTLIGVSLGWGAAEVACAYVVSTYEPGTAPEFLSWVMLGLMFVWLIAFGCMAQVASKKGKKFLAAQKRG